MEILPCPFCGGKPKQHPTLGSQIRCNNICAGSAGWVNVDLWNRRSVSIDQKEAFSQFKSSLDQEYTARTKAEALVKTLEGAIEEILSFLSKTTALPSEVIGGMMADYENYKKSKEI
jgi:hypothetical protein